MSEKESKGNLSWQVYDLIQEIEKCGASVELTNAVIEAGKILNEVCPTSKLEECSYSKLDDDGYVAWLRFDNGIIKVCDSDSDGAFKVWRKS